MFRLDSATSLPSPTLKSDLDSAKTEHLYPMQTFCDLREPFDGRSGSPWEKSRGVSNSPKLKKTPRTTGLMKHLQICKNKGKSGVLCKLKRKSTIILQNKILSSESFEKVLNEPAPGAMVKVDSSGPKEEKGPNAEHFAVKKGEIIEGKYKILCHLSDGTFGRVLKVRSLKDHKIYAMKVIKSVSRYIEAAKEEAKILSLLKEKDPEKQFHIIQMVEAFQSAKNYFLVFEKLGASLFDLIKINNFIGYPMKLLQSVLRQTLEALRFLHSLKLTHTDLKPENILFTSNKMSLVDISKLQLTVPETANSVTVSVDSASGSRLEDSYFYPQNDSIKVIDYGGATFDYSLHSHIINTRQYRAPEVLLGCCEWNNASDIWSLGCIVAELYTGKLLFDTHESYEHLAMIERIVGIVPYWMANRSDSQWESHFVLDEDFFEKNGTYFDLTKVCSDLKAVAKIKGLRPLNDLFNPQHKELLDLVRKMLVVNPKKRISCEDALKHAFFSQSFSDFCS